MTYQETVNWIFAQIPNYQNQGQKAYKADLSNINSLCENLGNPQNQFKSVHIAGTNGKGSTAHMTASVLQTAGYKTGLHTSPHLLDFRERTKIDGQMISEEFVVDFIEKNKEKILEIQASFFEVAVTMAFDYFAKEKVDIAVIETGLGGRLDATNILNPEVSVITNIGLDHTNILGNSLEEIAVEKAGIIKEKTPIIIGEILPETKPIFEKFAKEKKSEIYFAEHEIHEKFELDLIGEHQQKNASTAALIVKILNEKGFNISHFHLKEGLKNMKKNTSLRGRWEIVQENPKVVLDTGHNPHGIQVILNQIKKEIFENLHLVLGFVKDKNVEEILSLFPENAYYYLTQPSIERRFPLEDLKKLNIKKNNISYFENVKNAFDSALKNSTEKDLIFIGGSTFVVADFLNFN